MPGATAPAAIKAAVANAFVNISSLPYGRAADDFRIGSGSTSKPLPISGSIMPSRAPGIVHCRHCGA
jgi:hypothetical protein